ncbi:MAG: ATP-binding cassette domain-containing protein, partial [Rubritepida sp.]|nr:ATP-binding cassette domain-containing protein [Rubritepida sp.]
VRDAWGRARGAVRAVDGVSLRVMPGEVLAIVGESGCGKSTLGRVALRLIEPDAGRIRFDGEDFSGLPPRALRARRRDAQIIFQDPFGSLDPRMSVADAIAEPLILHTALDRAGRAERVAGLLRRVGLRPEMAGRRPHELSGGQRQRIAIARALASEPRLIIGDEPVSALDVSVQAQVLNLLQDLIRELRFGFVMISHDLGVVRHIADRVAVMYLGRIVEEGPVATVFAAARHPYTRALLAAVPGQGAPAGAPAGAGAGAGAGARAALLQGDVPSPIAPPPGCRFHTRCGFAQAQCSASMPELQGDTHRDACLLSDTLPPATPFHENTTGGERLTRLAARFQRETA